MNLVRKYWTEFKWLVGLSILICAMVSIPMDGVLGLWAYVAVMALVLWFL